jgi:hypothetical protein
MSTNIITGHIIVGINLGTDWKFYFYKKTEKIISCQCKENTPIYKFCPSCGKINKFEELPVEGYDEKNKTYYGLKIFDVGVSEVKTSVLGIEVSSVNRPVNYSKVVSLDDMSEAWKKAREILSETSIWDESKFHIWHCVYVYLDD